MTFIFKFSECAALCGRQVKGVLELRMQIRGVHAVNEDETNPRSYDFCYHSLLNPGIKLKKIITD